MNMLYSSTIQPLTTIFCMKWVVGANHLINETIDYSINKYYWISSELKK